MSRLRPRLSIKPPSSDPTTPAHLRLLHPEVAPSLDETDHAFSSGYRAGAVVAACLCGLAVLASLVAAVITR